MASPAERTSLAASTSLADADPPIALGALDGRYRGVVAPLVDHLSEPALNRELVLENELVFGTVNANRRHYQAAAAGLAKADQSWLERLISRRVPLDRWSDALQRRPDDVKAVIDLGG